ncbi:MAG: outer membrane beta-barrel protein [Cyclobacteriaceae bacterium]|nr:outer membrane beta-barrel protein [Cyclobacteriaceae bacterium]
MKFRTVKLVQINYRKDNRKRGLYRIITIVALCAFSVPFVFGQGEVGCVENLNSANEEFDAGHFYNVPRLLNDCLKGNGLTREQKLQAYYLLTRTYLYLDVPDSADYSYLEFLRIDPEYQAEESRDPIDIVYLAEKFTTSPVFSLWGKGGANLNQAIVVHPWGIGNTSLSEENYKIGGGFQLSGGAELHLGDYFSVGIDLRTGLNEYTFSEGLFSDDSVHTRDRSIWGDVPVFVKYTYKGKQYSPYILAGFESNFLMSSKLIIPEFMNIEGAKSETSQEPKIDMMKGRNFYSKSLLFGAGVLYKVGYNYICLELNYSTGLDNLSRPEGKYDGITVEAEDGIYKRLNYHVPGKFGYVDDDFRLNHFRLNIGFVKPLYKPRKKDKFTLRDLFNKGNN